MRVVLISIALVLACPWPVPGQQPILVGAEFQVNTYTPDTDDYPGVAVLPDGSFVVVWVDYEPYGRNIRGRKFHADGSPQGGEFQVNTFSSYHYVPEVSADANHLTVVWGSLDSNGTDDLWSVQGRRFSTGGSPLGGDFQINAYTTSIQFWPAVAATPDGGFVAVWESDGSWGTDSSQVSVQKQRFGSDGEPLEGLEFQVNTTTPSDQEEPAVAVDSDGGFLVVWHSEPPSGLPNPPRIQARYFDSAGDPVGLNFQVNSYTTGFRQYPAAAAVGKSGFLVVWESEASPGTDDQGRSIQARWVDPSGVPQGADFQVNTYTTGNQYQPAVSAGPGGDSFVVWASRGSGGTDTDNRSIQGRQILSDKTPLGVDFQVNTSTTDDQRVPAVSVGGDGVVVVVWSTSQDPSGDWDVRGQRLLFGTLVFRDGFESGNTSAWSMTVP